MTCLNVSCRLCLRLCFDQGFEGLSGTVILHSRADDVIPFADSEELAKNSGATLLEVGTDHRLADPEPLAAMLRACEGGS